MLSIQYEDVEEKINIGDFFNQIDFHESLDPTSDDGDTVASCQWPVEVLSLDGYYPIEGIRWTKHDELYRVTVKTESGLKRIDCADKHLILRQDPAVWTHAIDLEPGMFVVEKDSIAEVVSVKKLGLIERLCDLQVGISHSYYTNDIFSHNSHFLVAMGAHALKVGKNVVHYTFELTETSVGIRYDSHLTDIQSSDVQDSKEQVMDTYKNMELGRLIIKEYPTGTASVSTIRNHLEKLALRGFIPSLIVIDYADIMRSSREMDALRLELKLVYEDLRNLAMEKNIPIWTASQSNREGSGADVVGLENMSESYGKAMVADVVVSLSRKPAEKATGMGRMFVAKNRAGRDGIIFPVHIDTSRSKIRVLDENSLTLQESIAQDENTRKRIIKEKWQQVMGSK